MTKTLPMLLNDLAIRQLKCTLVGDLMARKKVFLATSFITKYNLLIKAYRFKATIWCQSWWHVRFWWQGLNFKLFFLCWCGWLLANGEFWCFPKNILIQTKQNKIIIKYLFISWSFHNGKRASQFKSKG